MWFKLASKYITKKANNAKYQNLILKLIIILLKKLKPFLIKKASKTKNKIDDEIIEKFYLFLEILNND